MTETEETAAEKSERGPTQGVALDGAKARTIREAKKLTQLYVASVVGVTTDTISRWENNRYPTIRRDNAEKLALALEVRIDEILRPDFDEPSAASNEPLPPPRRRNTWLAPATLLIIGTAIAVAAFILLRAPASPPAALRWVPHFAAPSEVIPVQIKVNRTVGNDRGMIIREQIPQGWTLVKASPPPAVTGEGQPNELKWLLPAGSAATISYTLRVDSAAKMETDVQFSGKSVTTMDDNSRTDAIGGRETIRIGGYHWADSNGDQKIDDNEILPAYYLTEEMKGLGLDWPVIEKLWSSGGYLRDRQTVTFQPKPQHAGSGAAR